MTPTPLSRSIAALLALCAYSAFADEPDKPTQSPTESKPATPAAGHSVHGEAFNDGPRQAAYLKEGQGKVEFPATTSNPEAQKFINQGVAQIHTFYYLEAERSFRQAAKLDPDCPMAFWGMAMSNEYNAKRARSFLDEAKKRIAKVKITRREQLYIDAMSARYQNNGDNKQAYMTGLETLVHEITDDLNAKAWLAMVAWQNGAQGSRKAIDTLNEVVLTAEPMHPGAHHYRIHLYDGNNPTRALKSAALYGKAAPGIAHAWHMPGHTYTELKRYADAAYQQEASARVDHAAMIKDRIMPFEIHNYAHNNQWLCTSLSHIGRVKDAVTVARNLAEQPRDPNKNGKNDGGSPQRLGRIRWAEVLTRYELWDDLIAATDSGAIDWSDVAEEKKQRAYTLGLAYAGRRDRAKLEEQIKALRALSPAQPQPQPPPPAPAPGGPGRRNPGSTTPVAGNSHLAELEGWLKLQDGDVAGAFESFGRANEMRGESKARAHLIARNLGFAEPEAKKAVDAHPNELPPLAAYVEVLHAVGKEKEAQEAYAKLEPLARHADRDLPVMQRVDAIVAGWRITGWSSPGQSANPGAETANDEAVQNRVDLNTLGPLVWSPSPAEPLAAADTDGKTWNLAEHKGRNVLVLFYLGGKCAHCMQQLEAFGKAVEELKGQNTDVVAVSTDDAGPTKELKQNKDGVKFPMPLLADAKLDLFKKYRAFDDFENAPLHGTFLIDASGDIRWQRISADPFLDVDFIKSEIKRLGALSRPRP